jgi:urease accessory protein
MKNTNISKEEFYLMQLADSFFPSGTFGMSGGLESFVQNGKIKNEKDVVIFLEQQLALRVIPCDCIILSSIIDAAKNDDIVLAMFIDNAFYSMKLIKEVRVASVRSGQQILNCVLYMSSAYRKNRFAKKFMHNLENKKTAGTYPACLGISAHCLGIQKDSAIRIMLYSYSVSITAAALRMGIIQHLSAQKILAMVANDMDINIKSIGEKSINDIWQLTPAVDVLHMLHEHEDIKMFIT